MVALTIGIEEIILALIHMRALHLLGRAPAFGCLHPVRDAAHIHLRHRSALAGVEILCGQNDIKLVIHLDDIAFAKGRSDDFHGEFLVFSPSTA